MAALSIQSIVETGIVPSFTAAAGGGDTFVNDGNVYLHVKNGGGGSITVGITAQKTSATVPGRGTLTKANGGGAVAAGAEKLFGPFPPTSFNNASGQCAVTYTAVTSVTVGAFKLPR